MCQICDHPQREAIDRAIVAGDSLRKIATMFATDKDAIRRHKLGCMTRTVPAITAPVQVPAYQSGAEMAIAQQAARSVASRTESLVARMEQAFDECQGTGNYDTLVKCAKEVREGLRLLAQLSGELGPNTAIQVNNISPSLTTAPEWGILMRILDRHPEIRAELTAALTEANL
jgi:hypothetical protein